MAKSRSRLGFKLGFILGVIVTFGLFKAFTFCSVENMINDSIEWVEEQL